MNTDTKEIDLRIRARYEGSKSLKELTDQLAELEKKQKAQSEEVDKGTGNIKELEQTYGKLERSLRAVAAAYAETRRYETQSATMSTAAQRLEGARAKYDAFAATLVKGADLTDKQAREQSRLAAAVDRASNAFERAQARLGTTGNRLRELGIDTGKLSSAQAHMSTVILNGNAALKAQEDAIDKAATAQKRLTGGEVSAALSRIKNQIVGMAAAYVSIQQGANLAGETVNAYSSREGAKNQLALSVGNDRNAVDEEYAYVRAQADRIGIEVDRAVGGYAKFAAAASMAGKSRDEIRYIWESFAEVGRVANLSADDLDGVFKALEQITSKGKIQAEELRGQLGDRLFGAFQVAAKALKDTYPDLDKAMKGGEVSAAHLVAIAEQYRKTVADQLPASMKSLAAEQARLNNAVLGFKLAIADAGFVDAFRSALLEISDALKSDDGKRFAESVSKGFSAAADAAVWLLKNADEVLNVLKALASLYAINAAGKAVSGVVDYANALKALAADAKLTMSALGLLRGSFAVLQAAMAGWAIGSYLSEEFETVRKAGIALVTGLDETWTRIKYGAQVLWEEIPRYAKNAFASMLNAMTWGTREMLEILQKGLQAVGRDEMAANVGRIIDKLTASYEEQGGRVAEIRAEMQREIDKIRDIGMEMWTDAERKPQAVTPKAPVTPSARPATVSTGGPSGPTEADIAKRQRLVDEITRALETLDGKIDRSQTDSLQSQLAAIDSQYAALSRKIGTLGGETGKEFAARLDASLEQLRAQTIAKFNNGLAAEGAVLMAKLDAVDAAAGRKSKTDLDARLASISTQYEATYREIAAFRVKLEANNLSTVDADSAKSRPDAGIAELRQIETQKFYRDELRRLEGEINNLLSTRSDRLKTIADQEAASLITSDQARAQTEAAVTTIQPQIEGLVDLAKAFAESLQGAFDPVALDAFVARLELAKGSGKRLNETFELTAKQVDEMIATRSVRAFESMADAIGGAIKGQQSWGDAIRGTGQAFLQFAADFLREIAMMILKVTLLKAIQNSGVGGTIGGVVSGMLKGAGVMHTGGVVGAGGGVVRQVSPFVFVGAPRYHAGGIAGLAPDEYATILKRNEEVLTEGDPRHVFNGGAGTATPAPVQNLKVINMIDSGSVVSEGLSSQAGEKAFFNFIRANKTGLKQILG